MTTKLICTILQLVYSCQWFVQTCNHSLPLGSGCYMTWPPWLLTPVGCPTHVVSPPNPTQARGFGDIQPIPLASNDSLKKDEVIGQFKQCLSHFRNCYLHTLETWYVTYMYKVVLYALGSCSPHNALHSPSIYNVYTYMKNSLFNIIVSVGLAQAHPLNEHSLAKSTLNSWFYIWASWFAI